jgi:metal-sulfur cluster biosynthetic enzyme
MDIKALEQAVVEKLSEVIDPETNIDVMKMRLVQDIEIDQDGKSPTCFVLPRLCVRLRFHWP